MKQSTLINILTVCLLFMTVACEDDRNNYMVDDRVSYLKGGLVDVSVLDEKYELCIIKSGKGLESATVSLALSNEKLAAFNETQSSAWTALGENDCSFSAKTAEFNKSDVRKIVNVTWDEKSLSPSLLGGDKVFPISLSGTGAEVNPDRDFIALRPVLTTVSFDQKMGGILMPSLELEHHDTVNSSLSVNIPVLSKDITVNLMIDNSQIDAYNEENATNYTAAPDGLVSLITPSVIISSGKISAVFSYVLDCSKFYVDGTLAEFTSYLVPIVIESTSDAELVIGQSVMYVPIVPLEVRTLMGPWTVLEGQSQCYGLEEGRPNWAAAYTVDRMVDGSLATEWISMWEHDNVFPMSFVFDTGAPHIFNTLKIKDHGTFQGNYRDYEFYVATEYKGAETEWTLIAKGMRGYSWLSGGNTYDFEVQSEKIGRYLKFVILKAQNSSGDYIHGRGKLCEVFGEGL